MPRIFGSASTGGGGTPGGSATQVQFNNAGAFGGITGATTDGTTLTLVAPVLGTPASATLTNATGLPPSTGLSTFVAPLKGGLGAALVPVIGDLLYADSTTSFARRAAVATGSVLASAGTGTAPVWSSTLSLSGNGALSAPAITGYGTWITGGTATTTKPYALIEPTGATSTGWSTSGTGLGVNAASGFTGNLLDLQLNGAARLKVALDGSLTSMGSLSIAGGSFIAFGGAGTYLDTPSNGNLRVNNNSGANSFTVSAPVASASATFQHGALDAAAPVAQTIKFQDVVAGTSNTAGVNATIRAPAGTGTGNGGSLIFQVAPAGSSGTAKNAWATALTIDSTKKVTLTGDLQLSNAYVATPQVPTGYITIYDSTGTAYKVSVNV